MNTFWIEGREYKARNEYDAVKLAYKMANRVEQRGYIGDETWKYAAIFACGNATIIVRRVRQYRFH